jgi:hypothetical protein
VSAIAAVVVEATMAARTAVHARRLHLTLVLGALGAAFAARLGLAWSHATPNYLPDEYL